MFGRKGKPEMTIVSPHPVGAGARGNIQGGTGWRAYPTGGAPMGQIGAFDGTLLNQFPAMLPGLQLKCGVESLSSAWSTPYPSPRISPQISQQNANLPGAQRNGQTYTGGIGPLTVAQYQANITAAQIRQSGLSAMSWAKDLQPST